MTDKVMKAKVRELLKDCHVIDKLTTVFSQAQAEAMGEVEQYILGNHDYGAIPETNEYANGWNDSRKRGYQQLKYLLSHFTNQSKEK